MSSSLVALIVVGAIVGGTFAVITLLYFILALSGQIDDQAEAKNGVRRS